MSRQLKERVPRLLQGKTVLDQCQIIGASGTQTGTAGKTAGNFTTHTQTASCFGTKIPGRCQILYSAAGCLLCRKLPSSDPACLFLYERAAESQAQESETASGYHGEDCGCFFDIRGHWVQYYRTIILQQTFILRILPSRIQYLFRLGIILHFCGIRADDGAAVYPVSKKSVR